MVFASNRTRSMCILIIGMVLGTVLSFLIQYFSLTNSYFTNYVDYDESKMVRRESRKNETTTNAIDNVRVQSDAKFDIQNIFPPNRTSAQLHAGEDDLSKVLQKHIRILCWIMTQPSNHESKAAHVLSTWGKRCNVLFFVSTQPFANHTTVLFPGNESREILWGKTKLGFTHAYDHYFDETDWFLKADDDTYVIMENLRLLLLDKDPASPVYYGCKYKVIVPQGYMSGGAGYVLSKEALRRFVEESLPDKEKCKEDDSGAEDAEMGFCLERVGVEAGDSRDQEGRLRFFPFVPQDHVFPKPPDLGFWYWKYIWYSHEQGIECCSDSVIAFHYIDQRLMWTLEYLVYHVHPFGINPRLTGSTEKDKIINYLLQRPPCQVKKTALGNMTRSVGRMTTNDTT